MSAKRPKIVIRKRETSDPKAIQNARSLGKDLFAEMGPDGERPASGANPPASPTRGSMCYACGSDRLDRGRRILIFNKLEKGSRNGDPFPTVLHIQRVDATTSRCMTCPLSVAAGLGI